MKTRMCGCVGVWVNRCVRQITHTPIHPHTHTLALALLLATAILPADSAATKTLAIRAARVFTMAGPPVDRGIILIRGGKIVSVGANLPIPLGAEVVDASTKVVIPGLVAAHTSLAERGDAEENVVPQARAVDAFDFHGDYDRLLEAGITTAYVSTGDRRLIGGQSAVVKLAGGSPAARTLRGECDLRVALGEESEGPPPLFRPPLPPTTDDPILPAQRQLGGSLSSQIALIRQLLTDARGASPSTGGGAGVLAKCLAEGNPIRFRANRSAEIRATLELARQNGIQVTLEGATEGYRMASELAAAKTPVVVTSPIRIGVPITVDLTRETALGRVNRGNLAALLSAGARAALAPAEDADLPELLMLAGSEVSQGVSRDAALRAVTLFAAEAIGVEKRIGSIAAGKDADIVILDGHPLDSRTRVEGTLINGAFAYRRKAASPPAETLAIRAGRILTATQGEIRNGVVVIRDGKIVEVSRAGLIPAGARVIDASNGVLIPGLIDAHSHLGLHAESEPAPLVSASPTSGSASARTRLLNAVTPGDSAYRDALRGGVTTVLLSPPTAGTVSGQASLLKTVECSGHGPICSHRVVRESAAICFNAQGGAPRMAQPWTFRDVLQRGKDYLQRRARYEQEMKDWVRDRGEAELQKKPLPREPAEVQKDEDLEPLAALFRKQIPALVHAERADEILNALKVFSEESELAVVLVGAGDGFRMTEEIRRRGASTAFGPTLIFRDKGRLVNRARASSDAGIPTILQSSGTSGAETLRLNAAYAVRYGMDPMEALRAVTINSAKALMVADRLGSIEVGKDADIVILSGDPWEAASRVKKVLVNGKVVYDGK